jgi:hypothetical protein
VAKGIGDAFSALVGIFRAVGDAISGVFRTAMNALIGIVNGIIRAVNSIQVHIGRIGLDTPAGFIGVGPFDWPGLQLSELRYLQAGVRNFEGGWAMLGERGPELARLPRGTDVFSAAQSRDLLAGSSGRGGPLIGSQTIYGVAPGDVERETRRALRRAALTWSLGGT